MSRLPRRFLAFVVSIFVLLGLGIGLALTLTNQANNPDSEAVASETDQDLSSSPVMIQNMNESGSHASESAAIELWSNPSTWTGVENLGGDGLPGANTSIFIDETRRIVIDYEGAEAKNIISQGTLEFQENPNGDKVSLDTGWLLVDGGALIAGSQTQAFADELVITLNDNDPEASTQSLTRTRNEQGELGTQGRIMCYGNMTAIDFGNHFVGVYSGRSMPQGDLSDAEYAALIDTPANPYNPEFDYDALVGISQAQRRNIPTRNPDPQVDTCQADSLPGAVGKISLHGDTQKTEWTYLTQTAPVQANQLVVEDATGWAVGDAIAITSTDYDHRQAEDFFITAVEGNTVTLDGRLNYLHYGDFVEGGVDQRAEVANLTRNVRIQTDDAIKERQVRGVFNEFFNRKFNNLRTARGHVLFSSMSQVQVDGVEFKELGQEGLLGKYAVHFHHGMDMSGSYLKNSSVHKSLNKCVALHITNNLLVENNVGYDVLGHCMYLETDEEWPNRTDAQRALRSINNTFRNNLVFDLTRPEVAQRSKSYDAIVSGYWITDSRNSFEGNVAGGAGYADGSHEVDVTAGNGGGHGFFVRLRTVVTGRAQEVESFPLFKDNKAHSNSQTGFWKLGNFVHTNDEVIENFTSHHNRLSNFWMRWRGKENPGSNSQPLPSNKLTVKNSKFADSLNGLYVASTGTLSKFSATYVEDNVFVGESANRGTVNPAVDEVWAGDVEAGTARTLPLSKTAYDQGTIVPGNNRGLDGIRGIELYDGPTYNNDNTFINFVPDDRRSAAAYTLTFDTVYQQHPFTSTSGNTFENANEVWWQPEFIRSGARAIILRDEDGSITGTPNANILNNSNFLVEDGCEYREEWNAHVCPQKDAVVLQVEAMHPKNRNHISHFQFTRDATGQEERLDRAIGGNRIFATNIYPNEWYTWSGTGYYDEFTNNPWFSRRFSALEYENVYDYQISLKHFRDAGGYVGFRLPMDEPPKELTFNPRNIGGGVPGDPETITELFDKNEIYSSSESSYFYDSLENMLYAKLFVTNPDKDSYNGFWDSSVTLIVDNDESLRTGEEREFYSSTENSYFQGRYQYDTKVCNDSLTTILDENGQSVSSGSVTVNTEDERILNVKAPDEPGTYRFEYRPCFYNTRYLQDDELVLLHDLDEDIVITPDSPRDRIESVSQAFPELPVVTQILEVKPANERPVMETATFSTDTQNRLVQPIVVSDADFNFRLGDSSTLEVVRQPEKGTLSVVEGASRIRYEPENLEDRGKYNFILRACDNAGDCSVQTFDLFLNSEIEVTNPVQFQVIQRRINGKVSTTNVPIEGKVSRDCNVIEARFGDNEYENLGRFEIDGAGNFSGILRNQEVGRATLSVRCRNQKRLEAQIKDVGVGDVYVVAGQSNAEGHGDNRQRYETISGETANFPTVYDEFNRWKIGNDDTDRGARMGSVWPIVGGYIAKETDVPVAFITTAKGSRDLVDTYPDWQDPERNKFESRLCSRRGGEDTLGPNCYQNMLAQVERSKVNAVRAILWFQGEEDVTNGTSRTDYTQALRSLANHAKRDLPGSPKLVAGVIGPMGEQNQPNRALDDIRLGATTAWSSANVLSGPLAYDIHIQNDGVGDDLHFRTDDELQTLGYRWWKSLEGHFYSDRGGSEITVSDIYAVERNRRAIGIRFKDISLRGERAFIPGDLDKELFSVREVDTVDGQNQVRNLPINRVKLFPDVLFIFLEEEMTDFTKVRVSYGLGNYAQERQIVMESTDDYVGEGGIQGIPAVPFRNRSIQRDIPTRVSQTQTLAADIVMASNDLGLFSSTKEAEPVVIEVANNEFIGSGIEEFVSYTNLPSEITTRLELINEQQLRLRFMDTEGVLPVDAKFENVEVAFAPGAFDNLKAFDTFEDTVVRDITIDFSTAGLEDSPDTDGDGIEDTVENAAPNGGDANNDGVSDATQSNVASLVSPLTGEYVALRIEGECAVIESVRILAEEELAVSDQNNEYPQGLFDFAIRCETPGESASVEIIFDADYDVQSWVYRQNQESAYRDISEEVTYATTTINDTPKTTVSYRLIDGAGLDNDNEENGVITSLAGPSVPEATEAEPKPNEGSEEKETDAPTTAKEAEEDLVQEGSEDSVPLTNQLSRTGGFALISYALMFAGVGVAGGYIWGRKIR